MSRTMSFEINPPPRLVRVSERGVQKQTKSERSSRREARRKRRLRKLRELDIHMMYMMLHDSTGAPIGIEEDQPRPVRVFGVSNANREARKAFVWEIGAENAPLKLSPQISHLVDLGTSCIYVFHGDESCYRERRLAAQIAKSYANRVEDYPSVVEVWCTLRAKCFFSGCRGYIARIKELFNGDALSEEEAPAAAVCASEGDASFNKNGALLEDGTRTAAGRPSWGWFDNSRGRTSLAVASAIGVIGVIATMAVVSRRR